MREREMVRKNDRNGDIERDMVETKKENYENKKVER